MSKTELAKLRRQLELINEAVSSDVYNLGGEFFETVVLKLNEVLGADYTFIGELSKEGDEVNTISLVNDKGPIENIKYALKETPCANVIGQAPCSYPKDVVKLFPNDQLLIDMGIEAYVGVPLYDSKKKPTGIIVCLFKEELKDIFAIESILIIFALRAGSELEHMRLYESLEKNKHELEKKVDERTKELHLMNSALKTSNMELEGALQDLQETQAQLIQSEKMASLGVLTSGVAHEINNPLNYIMGAYVGLVDYFNERGSYDSVKTEFLLNSIHEGIERIANIVQGLNQFSRQNENLDETCDIHLILNNCFTMLTDQTKHKVEIKKRFFSNEVFIKGNAGKMHQVFLNILINSIQSISGSGEIVASTWVEDEKAYVEIKDNGQGIAKNDLQKVTDPFFTTKPPGKGTGLGLSIALAIINEHKGIMEFESEIDKGTNVKLIFPLLRNSPS